MCPFPRQLSAYLRDVVVLVPTVFAVCNVLYICPIAVLIEPVLQRKEEQLPCGSMCRWSFQEVERLQGRGLEIGVVTTLSNFYKQGSVFLPSAHCFSVPVAP